MTFSVTPVPSATLTITAAASTGGDGSTSTVAITHAVTGWVQGSLMVFAYCADPSSAEAIRSLLQAAENVKPLL
ncbi:MAG: hypothetical protein LC623_05460 [Halobacteriales archaeon]|nr:hypothetical protein [Halobacteriales archaeon]